jgi:hypothetical protein
VFFDEILVEPILAIDLCQVVFVSKSNNRQGKQGRLARLGKVAMDEAKE